MLIVAWAGLYEGVGGRDLAGLCAVAALPAIAASSTRARGPPLAAARSSSPCRPCSRWRCGTRSWDFLSLRRRRLARRARGAAGRPAHGVAAPACRSRSRSTPSWWRCSTSRSRRSPPPSPGRSSCAGGRSRASWRWASGSPTDGPSSRPARARSRAPWRWRRGRGARPGLLGGRQRGAAARRAVGARRPRRRGGAPRRRPRRGPGPGRRRLVGLEGLGGRRRRGPGGRRPRPQPALRGARLARHAAGRADRVLREQPAPARRVPRGLRRRRLPARRSGDAGSHRRAARRRSATTRSSSTRARARRGRPSRSASSSWAPARRCCSRRGGRGASRARSRGPPDWPRAPCSSKEPLGAGRRLHGARGAAAPAPGRAGRRGPLRPGGDPRVVHPPARRVRGRPGGRAGLGQR